MQRTARFGGAEEDENQSQAHADTNRFADSEMVEDRPYHDPNYWWRGGIVPATLHVADEVKKTIRIDKITNRIALRGVWSRLQTWFDLCLATDKPGQTVLFCCPKGHTDSTICPRCDKFATCESRLTEFPHAYAHHQSYFTGKIVQRVMRKIGRLPTV